MSKILKTVLPLLIGVFLVWYSYHNTTPEDRQAIVHHISNANYFWVGIALLMGLISHVSRALRWNLLLEPMGYKPRFANNFMATMIAYLGNLGVPRSGEILRATTLSTYEKIPFQKAFGTIVTERVIDLIMLLLLVALTTLLQTEVILAFFEEKGIEPGKMILILILLFIIGIIGLYILRRMKTGFFGKLNQFISGLLEGVYSIRKVRSKSLFIFHTLLIWLMYVGMFFVIKFAIPETAALGVKALLAGFVAGAFAMSTTNGGIGLYPIAVGKILMIYGISKTSADAYGWIMWTSQTIMVIILGSLSFIVLPFFNNKK
ncbi:lysylphosphatidylglycerol synthase transmembrane domain-containing protein [Robertkochia solimangrovi]|uniref:lysylphosphatidylglycerol synthase transmembrane domain-containing protein n=1 Tax=Robertkochia solimangrovi TaxID=2213046 RepID=UPI001F54A957|nr:lysylphosphatidylglycerol synthase transmembrane domain-containing protein [Robertkochia solimangrovi]